MEYIGLVARAIPAIVFLAAARGKVPRLAAVADTLSALGISPAFALPLARTLILYEACIGLLLLSGAVRYPVIILTLLLLGLFAASSVRVIRRRAKIPCNCFGESDTYLGYATLARTTLLLMPVVIYAAAPYVAAQTAFPASLPAAVSSASLVGGGLLAGRWLLAAPDAWRLMVARRYSMEDEQDPALAYADLPPIPARTSTERA